MPRAALLSIHARVSDTASNTWSKPPFVQIWGPRFSTYVIAEEDVAVFTLGRLPDEPKGLGRAHDVADRLESALAGEKMDCRDAARIVGLHPNSLRYAAPTGRFLIHWDGARQPLIWTAPVPEVDPGEARIELARRFLHVFGPATSESFAGWAGVRKPFASQVFAALRRELVEVSTPIGHAWILASDETALLTPNELNATRLLPSGDNYYLLQGEDRELLLPDKAEQGLLWTPRVWPGAVLQDGEIVGTWRRSRDKVTIDAWRPLKEREREAVQKEAAALPLPSVTGPIKITWN